MTPFLRPSTFGCTWLARFYYFFKSPPQSSLLTSSRTGAWLSPQTASNLCTIRCILYNYHEHISQPLNKALIVRHRNPAPTWETLIIPPHAKGCLGSCICIKFEGRGSGRESGGGCCVLFESLHWFSRSILIERETEHWSWSENAVTELNIYW
jgi:hypothetical protein